LIEPKFLSLKDFDEKMTSENGLGMETYRMMLELGFWKKLVYITEGKLSLELCNKFINRDNLEIVLNHLNID
jgi:hypothetical protein